MPQPAEHLHPDDLALLALGEQPDGVDASHLDGCAQCRAEVDQLRGVVSKARTVTADDSPLPPPDRVWHAVAAELGIGPAAQPDPAAAPAAAAAPAGWSRRTALLAAAAALVGLLVGSVVTGLVVSGDDPGGGGVVASTRLAALPDHQGRGDAEVVGTGADRTLKLDVSGLTQGEGVYEVWLLDADGTRLVSLGLLDGTSGRFPLPPAVDLADYPVVDISLEPVDGDPAHSGDSVVRGTFSS